MHIYFFFSPCTGFVQGLNSLIYIRGGGILVWFFLYIIYDSG